MQSAPRLLPWLNSHVWLPPRYCRQCLKLRGCWALVKVQALSITNTYRSMLTYVHRFTAYFISPAHQHWDRSLYSAYLLLSHPKSCCTYITIVLATPTHLTVDTVDGTCQFERGCPATSLYWMFLSLILFNHHPFPNVHLCMIELCLSWRIKVCSFVTNHSLVTRY